MSNLKKFGPRQQNTASPEQESEDTESGQFKIIKRPGDTFPIYEVRHVAFLLSVVVNGGVHILHV